MIVVLWTCCATRSVLLQMELNIPSILHFQYADLDIEFSAQTKITCQFINCGAIP